ncbi:MAG: hypothetical protein HYZ89_05180 [Candidatus Omnitrophica bacterium]|nr:hypothetical protein [Candidatus Omnitrophota bacterium]
MTVMTGLWTLLLGSPLKLMLWAGNRLATWTGLLYLWRRVAKRPQRWRVFLVWALWINLLSLSVMAGLLYWLFASRRS